MFETAAGLKAVPHVHLSKVSTVHGEVELHWSLARQRLEALPFEHAAAARQHQHRCGGVGDGVWRRSERPADDESVARELEDVTSARGNRPGHRTKNLRRTDAKGSTVCAVWGLTPRLCYKRRFSLSGIPRGGGTSFASMIRGVGIELPRKLLCHPELALLI